MGDVKTCELPFCATRDDCAPVFSAEAYDPSLKRIKEVKLEEYRRRWVILFFYSSDFTFV
ncbi:redoxin domain-containing protein [Pseudalkalibacillus caeni]|uniref:Redoxin domain-containing protein n=2 Tax=Exobacillus caeni TaxID=2574798 RepID=A0A5R9FFM0_9BACL|nr:redoxin domain-containing protein [Pseudalkalibacillus caeni]